MEMCGDRRLLGGEAKKEEFLFAGNDVKIRAQWRKFVVICIVVQEIDWAKNVGGASVGRGRRVGVAMYGCKGQVVFVLAVGCTENGRLEEEEFV
ncbi:hypothetical protein P5775_29170 [Bacillus cereus]|uniref:hypothetical protein n=1 Tax=Bacillus cereus TaxID=1396 RepID=UPI002405ADA5|nr:hypothetical protein [Bacillus cereus]MDF9626762.1 hypothetical protein [Bacillus cereus]